MQIVHGVREEMALKLTDVVMRRTELGSTGSPGDETLETCARLMGRELGWNDDRIAAELSETKALFTIK